MGRSVSKESRGPPAFGTTNTLAEGIDYLGFQLGPVTSQSPFSCVGFVLVVLPPPLHAAVRYAIGQAGYQYELWHEGKEVFNFFA